MRKKKEDEKNNGGGISYKKLSHRVVSRFGITHNTVILIKEVVGVDVYRFGSELTKAITAAGLKNVVLASVKDFDDIQALDEKRMNQSGWYRFESTPVEVMRKFGWYRLGDALAIVSGGKDKARNMTPEEMQVASESLAKASERTRT